MPKQRLTLSGNARELIQYFVLAYAFSWAIGIPLALQKQHLIKPLIPYWTHYLIGFGPMLAALLVSWHTHGSAGLRRLGQRIFAWKVHPGWWLVACLPLIFGFAVILFLNLVGDSNISIADLGTVHFLPPLGLGALFLWIFTFGLGEETGWRGFALPRLQQHHNALKATSILAVCWALWHLPQFFYLFPLDIALGWAIGLFAGAIVFTWLFNSTHGSIPVVAVFHGCVNYISSANIDNIIPAATISVSVMVWAVIVILFYKPENLSKRKRVIA
jgi:membrane protease YdiL (CAAX protease family)